MRSGYFLIAVAAVFALQGERLHAQQPTIIFSNDSLPPAIPPYARLFKGMQLSQAQSDSMAAIWKRFEPMVQQINREGGGAKIVSERHLALGEQRRAAMRKHLTPAQQETFDKTVEVLRRENEAVFKAALEAEAKDRARP